MSLKYEHRLIEHLAHDRYQAADIGQLAEDLGVDDADRDEFERAVRELAKQGKLNMDGTGKARLPSMPEQIVGRFRKNPPAASVLSSLNGHSARATSSFRPTLWAMH